MEAKDSGFEPYSMILFLVQNLLRYESHRFNSFKATSSCIFEARENLDELSSLFSLALRRTMTSVLSLDQRGLSQPEVFQEKFHFW